eukprot:TRINITY_DN20780_c0_g1_i1.p1 TRINITY_DN20780_c0_g1~~TRINITY_DN20780_c0_g1_i1.p1  ORF type:complete len:408 (+),score=76.01 TRINITY_DN20780_c0_g1_i1:158-1381(+)
MAGYANGVTSSARDNKRGLAKRDDDESEDADRMVERSRGKGGGVGMALGAAAVAAALFGVRLVKGVAKRVRGSPVEPAPPAVERQRDWEEEAAGREGEEMFRQSCVAAGGVQFFQSVRIPDRVNRRRREIDFVILSRRELLVVEVKNWSGRVSMGADGRWCQVRKNNSLRWCPNVLEETKEKAQLLMDYILCRGVTIPDKFIAPRVVLVNANCSPDAVIADQPEILLPNEWESAICGSGQAQQRIIGWFSSLVGGFTGSALSLETHRRLQDILGSAPTWDTLELTGMEQRVVKGDLVRFNGKPDDMAAVSSLPMRPSISRISVNLQRSHLPHYLGALVGFTPSIQLAFTLRHGQNGESPSWMGWVFGSEKTSTLSVSEDTEVEFRPAGATHDLSFRLMDVKGICLST